MLQRSSTYSGLTIPDPVALSYLRVERRAYRTRKCHGCYSYRSIQYIGYFYKSTMTGNETLVASGARLVALLDPNGADRTVDVAPPTDDYEVTIVNTGSYLLTFDPLGLGQSIAAGQKNTFYYDSDSAVWY